LPLLATQQRGIKNCRTFAMTAQFNSGNFGVSCWVAKSGNPTYDYFLIAFSIQQSVLKTEYRTAEYAIQ